jgi:hypothetical protein
MIKDQIVDLANQQLAGQVSEALLPLNEDPRITNALSTLVGRLGQQVRRASVQIRKSMVGKMAGLPTA